MAWEIRRPRDFKIMFVVGYADGRTAYVTISPRELERSGNDPRGIVSERQKAGEIPEGEVVTIKRAR
jgi:hypothetical protein